MTDKEKKDAKTGVRWDGWGTMLSGFKRRRSNKSIPDKYDDDRGPLTLVELYEIMHTNGFGKRVVDCVAEDMIREGLRIVGDTSDIVRSEMKDLGFFGKLKEAITYARAYGGGALLLGIDDGALPADPVRVNSIKKIRYIMPLPAYAVKGDDNSRITDRNDPNYGAFERYVITDGISEKPYNVHRDRILLITTGVEYTTPMGSHPVPVTNLDVRVWGHSVLDPIAQQVSDISLFGMSLSHLAQEAVIGKYKVAGLAEMLASDDDERIYNRLEVINDSKSTINGVLLDADNDEDYTRDSLSFSGINGVADTQMVFLSGVAGIPVTRLFGRSPSGLDASGESDLTIYYDKVHAEQESMLTHPVQRLIFYINQYKKAIFIEPAEEVLRRALTPEQETDPIKKVRPTTEADIHIEWNPLRQMTQKEKADTYMTNAQADMQYITMGVLSREEVRNSRFVNGYSQEISVDTSALPEKEEEVDPPEEGDDDEPATPQDVKGKDKGKDKKGTEANE